MKLEKHYDGTRPVFDPTLPADMLQGLRVDTVEIQEAPAGARPRLLRTRRERLITGAVPFTITLVGMAVCDFVLGQLALSIMVGFLGLFLYFPVRLSEDGVKEEVFSLGFGLFWFLLGVWLSGFGGAFFPLLVVHLLRFGLFLLPGKAAEYVVPADRFVDPSTLGFEERKKLRWVQNACDRVERAQRLIPGFDGRSALIVLREEEWLVGRDLARIAPLSAEVERLKAEAASDRVREAMRPQVAAVEAAYREASQRLTRIGRYMGPVDAALTAYQEWEQLSQLARGTDGYTDLVAHGGSEPAGPLPHDLHGDPALHAARTAIGERVREAHEAAAWLASATRADG
ncbi:hypothetical protein AB0I72_07990 [Nocardiopsis sp. NPDC049922]|uniref:hypothetical protein n=1 Tax=Nocardiopsis sp. NPDC049922 TaxID=3155157 RepID=UPI0033DFD992